MNLQPDDPALFHASLDRTMRHPEFLQSFYRRFMDSSEEIAAMFKGRDMGRIQKKLIMTLQTVSEHTEGQPGLAMYLELLGRIHQRLNITPEQFTLWRNALIETAEECDELFTPQLRGAWERAIDAVIERMRHGG